MRFRVPTTIVNPSITHFRFLKIIAQSDNASRHPFGSFSTPKSAERTSNDPQKSSKQGRVELFEA
jgi:hypothetical protein